MRVRSSILFPLAAAIVLLFSHDPSYCQISDTEIAQAREQRLMRVHTPRFAGDQVDSVQLLRTIEALSGEKPISADGRFLSNRYTAANKELVLRYLEQELRGMGLSPTLEEFSTKNRSIHGDRKLRGFNVIAEVRGKTRPNDVVEIMAHYDSQGPLVLGADDNASGIASALETARIAQRFEPDRTVRFVFSDFEEAHFEGSRAHAKKIASGKNEKLIGSFVIDMIGYHPETAPPFAVDLEVGTASKNKSFANQLLAQSDRYVDRSIQWGPITVGSLPDTADHGAYWKKKLPAVLISQSMEHGTPEYHLASDTIEKINVRYLDAITREVTEAVASISGFRTPEDLQDTLKQNLGKYEALVRPRSNPSRDYLGELQPVYQQYLRRAREKARVKINPIELWWHERAAAEEAGLLNSEQIAIRAQMRQDLDAVNRALETLGHARNQKQFDLLTQRLAKLTETVSRRWDISLAQETDHLVCLRQALVQLIHPNPQP